MADKAIEGRDSSAAAASPVESATATVVRAWTDASFERLTSALQEARSALGAPRVAEAGSDVTDTLERQPAWVVRPEGRVRKVSVSIPEDLTDAVRRRVGRGAFSQYVTAAVARQLEVDLLAELAAVLEAEHGPAPEDLLKEAMREWPDHGLQ
jgi:Arc/MetJ-type ribon-helix-helix transcriptional regulator